MNIILIVYCFKLILDIISKIKNFKVVNLIVIFWNVKCFDIGVFEKGNFVKYFYINFLDV